MNIAGRMLWTHLKLPGITVSVQPKPAVYGYAFEAQSVTDLGCDRRIAALKSLDSVLSRASRFALQFAEPVKLPRRIGALELLYTSRMECAPANIEKIMQAHCGNARLRKVSYDVLMPGDIVIFKETPEGFRTPDTYRIISESRIERQETQHAL